MVYETQRYKQAEFSSGNFFGLNGLKKIIFEITI